MLGFGIEEHNYEKLQNHQECQTCEYSLMKQTSDGRKDAYDQRIGNPVDSTCQALASSANW